MTTSLDASRSSFTRTVGSLAAFVVAALLVLPGLARAQVTINPTLRDSAVADTTPLPPMPPAPPPAVWVDLDRNLPLLRSPKQVAALVDSIADAGFKRIVVDVKLRDGRVAYKSRVAPRLDAGFDWFGTFRAAATKRGLSVEALVSVFVDGDVTTRTGPAYDHPEWQQVILSGTHGVVRQGDSPEAGQYLLLNPVLPSVQRYEATAISDLIQQLKPDALVLNEMRYVVKEADLSDSTRILFDQWTGMTPLEKWPDDVLNKEHPRFPMWQAFRVGIIHEFLGRIRKLRDGLAPGMKLVFSGPSYYEPSTSLGMNWAWSKFKPPMWWANAYFQERGLADLVDELSLYSRDPNPIAVREIVRGVKKVVHHERPVSLILSVDQFQRRPGRLLEVIQTLQEADIGIAISDATQIGPCGMWDVLGEAFAGKAPPAPGGGGK